MTQSNRQKGRDTTWKQTPRRRPTETIRDSIHSAVNEDGKSNTLEWGKMKEKGNPSTPHTLQTKQERKARRRTLQREKKKEKESETEERDTVNVPTKCRMAILRSAEPSHESQPLHCRPRRSTKVMMT